MTTAQDRIGAVQQLGKGQVFSYGVGEFGKALFIHAPNFLWLFFLTEVIGLAPGVAGMVILFPMLWDAVTDPLFGFLADRTRTRLGKYVPYLIFGTPVCAVLFALFFTDPGLTGGGAIALAVISAIAFRTVLTVVDVPHNSLMARVTRSSRQRSVLAGSKMFFGALSMVAVAAATQSILAGELADEQAAFTRFAVIAGIIATLCLWQNAWTFRKLDRSAQSVVAVPHAPLHEVLKDLRTNSYVWILMVAGMVGVLLLPAFAKTLLYFGKYNLADEPWGPKALLVFTISTAASIPVWGWAGGRFEKITLLRSGHMILIAALLGFLIVATGSATLLLVMVGLAGVAFGGINTMTFALLPDVVELGQSRTGRRVEAPIFGCFTFSLKLGNGLGAGLLGGILAAIGFVSGEVQTDNAERGILLAMTLMPVLGAIIVLALLRSWKLTHSMHSSLVLQTEND